jgi:hypothetical protein
MLMCCLKSQRWLVSLNGASFLVIFNHLKIGMDGI